MLKNLLIRNYVLISELELQPSSELNIVTGETGAGKSIMLGALGLLLGNRADVKVLFNEEEKCIIEGAFDISGYDIEDLFEGEDLDYETQCLVRREIAPSGKSRAFVNDTPVNLDFLKKLGQRLMDVHSQHETLMLGASSFQIGIVDAFAGNKILLGEYKKLYKEFKDKEAELVEVTRQAEESSKQQDFNTFLLSELEDADLQSGEQEKLEEDLKLLENSEEIKSKLNQMVSILSESDQASIAVLQSVNKLFDGIVKYSPSYEKLRERFQSIVIELKDINGELEEAEQQIDYSPGKIEEKRERLSLIYKLEKKHHVNTIEELIAIQEDLENKAGANSDLFEKIEILKTGLVKLEKSLREKAVKLSNQRTKVIPGIKKELESLLKEVGMPNATMHIHSEPTELGPLGIDKINFLFSANKGISPEELKNAASGGEFSRLMLCIKYMLADKSSLPTIVFDEIDTGISGEVAFKVGKMMKQMSKNHQVLAITHLPQIAAQGSAHYFVYKDHSSKRSVSRIKELTKEDRVKEIAQMIGGEKPSETAIKNAKELLEINE
ncbi:DNA repair protein RecN [Sporocytophaga myxococcoides]|uniref:DNA repair protein RecN n=1 Tax=Sporocytophaga myxococcoides TaxID=153721 RepID=A0A098LKF3_9BACT|nr:DNA repair protein RecN [Sporocytophaga myxococcoides]GAL86964.1 DNA repair protein RecN [Sporocytophaga myxococcoides]